MTSCMSVKTTQGAGGGLGESEKNRGMKVDVLWNFRLVNDLSVSVS